jgi:hypothetical protein
MHAILDVATLGLWEFIGTPIELVKGRTRRLTAVSGLRSSVFGLRSSVKKV